MDHIQQKLALIDRQLAGWTDLHRQIINTCPLLFVATGLIAGILLQDKSGLSISVWLILLALCTTVTVLIFVIRQRDKGGSSALVLLSTCVLICFVCLGGIRLTRFRELSTNDISNLVTEQRKLATIRGLIITDPHRDKRQWQFAKFTHSDPGSSFYLKIDEVKSTTGWVTAAGTVRARADEAVLDLKAGDYIQAYCWLDSFKEPTNPGQFNTAGYLARKNVFVAASIKSRDGIELLKSRNKGVLTRIKRKLRKTVARALLGPAMPDEPEQGLLQALLLGYRGGIDSDTYRAFRKTGLLHFISLSGMHLGILIGTIWWLCRTVGLMKRARAIICIIAIGIFLLVVPARSPTLRAAIIGWTFCASFLFRRHSSPFNTLSLAAVILLLIRPIYLFEAGWQLSFASVLGILLFCKRFHFFLYEKITGLPWDKKTTLTRLFFRIISRPGPYLLRLFSTGVTAWLGGAGILLYHFYTITPLTCVWTVIAFPFVALILTLGFLKILLSFLLPTAAWGLGVVVGWLCQFLIWIVGWLADLDVSQILIGHVPAALIIFYYALVPFAGFVYFRRPLFKKAICTVSIAAIIFFLGVTKWQRTHRNNLVLTALNVGHGQAILARMPGKANILFDAGSADYSDIGRRIVSPFLDHIGISKINAIVISHSHFDHINGIPEITEHCEVQNVYANDAFFSSIDDWGTAKFLNKSLCDRGLEIQHLAKDLIVPGAARIKILWPTEQVCADSELSDNNKSTVALIEFAGRKILLCSDIEKCAQNGLLHLFPHLKANVVVVPHHGSPTTSDPDFLEHLDADVLICNCRRSRYERLSRVTNRANWLYTPKDGAITVCIDKDGTIKMDTFTK